MGKKVLLYSCGLDSWLVDKLWKPDVKLYVNIGSLGSKAEILKLPDDVIVETLDISKFELPEKNYMLPLRNLFLCMMAMHYGDTICMGTEASSVNLDTNEQFCKLTSDLLTYLSPQVYGEHREVNVVVPYCKYSKTELLRMYLEQGGDIDLAFKSTTSCYNPNSDGTPCNECHSCLQKLEAFRNNGYDC